MPSHRMSSSGYIMDKAFWSTYTGTLTIKKAEKKDGGTYICTARNAMTTLIVNVMPQFTVKPPKKIEFYHAHSVTLDCSADGSRYQISRGHDAMEICQRDARRWRIDS